MISLTPTFLSEYRIPGNANTNINVPSLVKTGKKITLTYADKAYFKNPVFPAELYEYRRGKK